MSPRRTAKDAAEESAIFTPEADEASNGNGNGDIPLYGDVATDGIEAESRPTPPPEDEERAPVKRAGPRVSAAHILTMLVGFGGQALVQTGRDIPVGRVLELEAPIAGNKLDSLLAHTWLDRTLQPLIAGAESVEGLGSLVLFPLLIGAYERNPAAAPVIYPMLRSVVGEILVDLVPVMRKQKADQKRVVQAVAELKGDLDLDPSLDPIDAIIQSLFANAPGFTTEPPDADEPIEEDA